MASDSTDRLGLGGSSWGGLIARRDQRLADAARAFRATGRSDHSIAVEFGVSDKTVANAIRCLRA